MAPFYGRRASYCHPPPATAWSRNTYCIPTISKIDVWPGTLALEALGPLHGYGVARRIEQTSGDLLAINYGTLYPQLIKLEQAGYIAGEWGVSENGRKAKFYRLIRTGRTQLASATQDWEQAGAIMAKFLAPKEAG